MSEINPRLAAINKRNRCFYASIWKPVNRELRSGRSKSLEKAVALLSEETLRLRVSIPSGHETKKLRLTLMPSFEEKILAVTNIRSGADQSKRAKHRRVRIGDALLSKQQIIEELANVAEYRDLTARELWPHFLDRLDQEGCSPQEVKNPVGRIEDCIEYRYCRHGAVESTKRKMTFATFANGVSQARRSR
jgi:hypothetical protein